MSTRELRSQTEIAEKVQQHERDMTDQTERVEWSVEDIETVRNTGRDLMSAGTSDAADAVQQALEAAESVSRDGVEEGDRQLEQLQQEARMEESDIQERRNAASSDLGKISAGSTDLHSDGASDRLIAAKEAELRDIEFLEDQERKAREARDKTEHARQQYRDRTR